MSDAIKNSVNEMKVAKYEVFIKDINDRLQNVTGDDNILRFDIIPFGLPRSEEERMLVLALVYDYGTCNKYARVIMDNATLSMVGRKFKNYSMDDTFALWHEKYQSYENFRDIKEKIDATKIFVKLCKNGYDIVEGYKFIFWALMILTVDQSDAEEHLSLICDLANMLHITDDEFEDIIQVVKTVCNGSMSEYIFKSEKVSEIFSDVLSKYTS